MFNSFFKNSTSSGLACAPLLLMGLCGCSDDSASAIRTADAFTADASSPQLDSKDGGNDVSSGDAGNSATRLETSHGETTQSVAPGTSDASDAHSGDDSTIDASILTLADSSSSEAGRSQDTQRTGPASDWVDTYEPEPTCRLSGSCSTGNAIDDCDGTGPVATECSGCALLSSCGGVSCCDRIVATPHFLWAPDVVTSFTQNNASVSLTATLTNENPSASIVFQLARDVRIDLTTLQFELVVTGDATLTVLLNTNSRLSTEDCTLQVTTEGGVTKPDLDSALACSEYDPVSEISFILTNGSPGPAGVTVNSMTWQEVDESCNDTCNTADDGSCDDGGKDAMDNRCAYGNDCSDCGPRTEPLDPTCSNNCDWINDGLCDDGGKDAWGYYCEYGTDCSDCGPRTEPFDPACNNTCFPVFSNDVCDDGGPGSETEKCELGTDCVDCGPR